MAIPPTASPSGVTLHQLTSGEWEATCGRCLSRSLPMAAVDGASAWTELQKFGWIHYVSEYGGVGYAVCADCLKAGPPDVRRRGARRRK